jgi:hypothetical protein
MDGKQLKGKTVKKVHQSLHGNEDGRREWCIDAMEFTDGSCLRFTTFEEGGDYGTIGIYPAHHVETKATP